MSIRMPSRITPCAGAAAVRARRVVLALVLSVAAGTAHAEPPELLADFGGGNTELREVDVSTFILGSIGATAVESIGSVSDIEDMRIRYKLYTLLGEPAFDALLFWDLSSQMGQQPALRYDPRFYHGLSDKAERATGYRVSGPRSIRRTDLAEHPDLHARFDRIKPLSVTISATIGIEGTRPPSSSNLNLADQATRDRQRVRAVRAEIEIDIDLPNRRGVWQRLSVPSSPYWDDLDPLVREVFARREPGEDVVIYEAELKSITWPDFEIHSIAAEYLSREIEQAEAELSDEDFFSRPPADLDDSRIVDQNRGPTRFERGASARESAIERRTAQARARADELRSQDSDIDVRVRQNDDGTREFTVSVTEVSRGVNVILLDASGVEMDRMDTVVDERSITIDGTVPLVHFERNGELIARYTKLAQQNYETSIVRLYELSLRYRWNRSGEDRAWHHFDQARVVSLSLNGASQGVAGENFRWEADYDVFIDDYGEVRAITYLLAAEDGVELSIDTDYIDPPFTGASLSLFMDRYTPARGDIDLTNLRGAIGGRFVSIPEVDQTIRVPNPGSYEERVDMGLDEERIRIATGEFRRDAYHSVLIDSARVDSGREVQSLNVRLQLRENGVLNVDTGETYEVRDAIAPFGEPGR